MTVERDRRSSVQLENYGNNLGMKYYKQGSTTVPTKKQGYCSAPICQLSCTPSERDICNTPESLCVTFLIISYILALFTFNKIISIYMGCLVPKPFANETKEMQPSSSQLAEERTQKAQMSLSLPHQAPSALPCQGDGCEVCPASACTPTPPPSPIQRLA